MKKRTAALILAVSTVLLMTACGGQTSSSDSTATTETASSQETVSAADSTADAAATSEAAAEEQDLAGSTAATEESAAAGTEIAALSEEDQDVLNTIGGTVLAPSTEENAEEAQRAGISEYSVSESMIGYYTSNGYVNPEFGFRIVLPSRFTLESRTAFTSAAEDVVEQANDDDAYDWVRSQLSLGTAMLFGADDGTTYLNLYLEGLDYGEYAWDDEKTVAENTADSYQADLEAVASQYNYTVTDFEYGVDTVQFDGETHYAGYFTCYIQGVPYAGIKVYIPADDGEHYLIISFEGTNGDALLEAFDYFQEY